jgi:hypothetical protein
MQQEEAQKGEQGLSFRDLFAEGCIDVVSCFSRILSVRLPRNLTLVSFAPLRLVAT